MQRRGSLTLQRCALRAAWAVVLLLGSTLLVLFGHVGGASGSPLSPLPSLERMQLLGGLSVGLTVLLASLAGLISRSTPVLLRLAPEALGWLIVLGLSGLPLAFALSLVAHFTAWVPVEEALRAARTLGSGLALLGWTRLASLSLRF